MSSKSNSKIKRERPRRRQPKKSRLQRVELERVLRRKVARQVLSSQSSKPPTKAKSEAVGRGEGHQPIHVFELYNRRSYEAVFLRIQFEKAAARLS